MSNHNESWCDFSNGVLLVRALVFGHGPPLLDFLGEPPGLSAIALGNSLRGTPGQLKLPEYHSGGGGGNS